MKNLDKLAYLYEHEPNTYPNLYVDCVSC